MDENCGSFLMVTSEMIIYSTETRLEGDDADNSEPRLDLWKMNLDGTDKKRLVYNMGVYENRIWVDGDWIYYISADFFEDEEVKSLKRIDNKGQRTEQILETAPLSYVICDGWMYYIENPENIENCSVHKIDLDNLSKRSIHVGAISFKLPDLLTFSIMNTDGSYIFITGEENIYFSPVGAEELKPLSGNNQPEQCIVFISFVNEWIYYHTGFKLFRVTAEGKTPEEQPQEYLPSACYITLPPLISDIPSNGQNGNNGNSGNNVIPETITTPAPPSGAIPAQPSGLKAVQTSAENALISWEISDGATSYEAEFYSRSEMTWKPDPDYDNKTAVSYISKGLSKYDTYQYRVRAVNTAGVSEWTEVIYYKTVIVLPERSSQ
jgi:hypothetical protein